MMRLVVPPRLWSTIVADLLATPELERAGVGFGGIATVGRETRVLLRDWLPVANDEYISQLAYHLEVSPLVYARAAGRTRRTGEALIIFHSHPGDPDEPRFSASDDVGESRLVPKLQARAAVPIVAAVVSPGGVLLRGTTSRGRTTQVALSVAGSPDAESRSCDYSEERFDRQLLAIGEIAHRMLRTLTIGVVGAGGLGAHVVQQLTHLGVGRIVVIDDDTVDESNLSRLVGARASDALLHRRKTSVAARVARQLGGGTKVTMISGSFLDERFARRLLCCDVIFGCTDNHWSRMVLNSLAFQYYIHVIDCGVELQAASRAMGGRVSWLAPGGRCLWCMGVLDAERVRAEQLPTPLAMVHAEQGYIPDVSVRAPAVVSINGVVASVAVTEMLARTTGFAGSDHRADLLLYRLADGTIRRITGVADPRCRICGADGVTGLGDLAGMPWRMTTTLPSATPSPVPAAV